MAFSHARAVLPAYLDDLGATNFILGVLTAVWVVGSSVPQAFAGYFTEHRPSKKGSVLFLHYLPPLAWLGLFLYNYYRVPGASTYTGTLVFFIVMMAFYSCALGVLMPVYLNFLSRVTEEKKRGSAFGTIFSAQCIFGAWAVASVGFLIAGRGFPRNYALLFLLTFAFICLGNLFFIPVREKHDAGGKARRSFAEHMKSLAMIFVKNRQLRKYIFLRLLLGLNLILVFFYVKHAKGVLPWIEPRHVRYFVVFLLIGQASGNLLFGRLADRLGFKSVAVMGAALMLGATCVAVCLQTLAGFYIAMASAGAYLAADWISHLNIVLALSGARDKTSHVGLAGLLTSLPLALASLVTGYLIDVVSFAAVALTASALAGLGALLLVVLIRMPGPQRAEELAMEPRQAG